MKKIVFLILIMGLCGCRDGRPSQEEARDYFEGLYPDVELIDIHLSEDEVVARSYKFRYREKTSNQEREIEIQFMEDEGEAGWLPRPQPPRLLP